MNSIRTQPVPWLVICSIRPLRSASSWVTAPRYSSGTSMVSRSNGSCSLPSIVLGDHLRLADGQLEALAAHLLDQDGQRQLAAALHLPGVGPLGGQHPDRHVADQLARRAGPSPCRAVSLVPLTWPASGEVLMPIVIEIAGSSTVISGSATRVRPGRPASRRS